MLRKAAISLASILTFLLIWELYYWTVIGNPFLLSPPSKVFLRLFELAYCKDIFCLHVDILYSLYHYALGFSAAIVVGFSVGVLSYSKLLRELLYPIIELLRPIPPIAWIPIAILLLKLTHTAAAFIIFIGAVFPIMLNTAHAVVWVERRYLEAALTLGAKTKDLLVKVIIPASLPAFLNGLRVGSGVAWMCVVAAELFGVSQYGLGYKIELGRYYHSTETILAYMLAIGIIGLILDNFYRFLSSRILKWREGLTFG